jgi:SsrA-binding protein
LRAGKATIAESYADTRGGELWLINSNIPEYLQASRFNHAPKRARKLLLQKREINRLTGAVEREGMTIVPLKLYFNEKGRAKVEIALARGKKLHDKRETLKKRSWERERGRLMRMKAAAARDRYGITPGDPPPASPVGSVLRSHRFSVNDDRRTIGVIHRIRLALLKRDGGIQDFDCQILRLRNVQIAYRRRAGLQVTSSRASSPGLEVPPLT